MFGDFLQLLLRGGSFEINAVRASFEVGIGSPECISQPIWFNGVSARENEKVWLNFGGYRTFDLLHHVADFHDSFTSHVPALFGRNLILDKNR